MSQLVMNPPYEWPVWPTRDVIDAPHHVFAVFIAPCTPRRPLELLAVVGRAAEVRVEHVVALRREELFLEIKRVAGRRVRAAVTEDDQRRFRSAGRHLRRRRIGEPAFDLRAVLARPFETIRLAERNLTEERAGRVR
jgi:hypothetical protein